MFMTIKKILSLIIIALALMSRKSLALAAGPSASSAATEESIMDDSLRDMSVVLGVGASGAVIGLSTLSFVDSPSKHLKNITVGGAVGIVIGVGIVAFTQATKSSSAIGQGHVEIPMNAQKYATLAKQEFSDEKIAKDYLKVPTIGYNFTF